MQPLFAGVLTRECLDSPGIACFTFRRRAEERKGDERKSHWLTGQGRYLKMPAWE